MRATIEELMELLGVGYVLGPYDTAPWSHYDSDTGTTCNAEVRLSSDASETNAEIQVMYDDPPAGKAPMEQVCFIKITSSSDGKWTTKELLLNGAPLEEDIYNWEEKSCNFFSAVVQDLKLEKLPDFDDLIDEHFHNRERLNDQYGGGGGKSPKIKPSALTGMKKGGGGF